MESKELGLVLGEKLLGLESLHYGYWKKVPQEENYTLLEIIQAQKEYTKFFLTHIEHELKKIKGKKILDIGSGTGEILKKLLEKKYYADGLIPSKNLYTRVTKKIETIKTTYKPRIFNCLFENILEQSVVLKYDLVFFSESFQYIPMEDSFNIANKILKKNGVLVLCDFFKKKPHNSKDLHLVGGGHLWKDFQKIQKTIPFKKIKEVEITKNVSPTIEIGSYILQKRFSPSLQIIDKYLKKHLKKKYTLLKKLLQFIGKKELQKFQEKYLLGKRTGTNFEKNNRYILVVFQKK